jgi:hypothetical protein
MRAEQQLPRPKTIWKVSVWKDEIDPSSPWWQRAYFKYVYLLFQDFSFWLGIPKTKEVVVESDKDGNVKRTYLWFEDIGSFDTEEQADAACLTERYGYKEQPHGLSAPFDSAQFKGTFFPRKKRPRKWAKPTLSLIIKDRRQDEQEREQLTECLKQVNQVLSQ